MYIVVFMFLYIRLSITDATPVWNDDKMLIKYNVEKKMEHLRFHNH